MVIIAIIITILYNNKIEEGFLTDAQLNNIFFMDPYYVAYDNFYDPNRLMTKPLIMADDKVTGVLDETIDSAPFNDNIKYNYVKSCDSLTTEDKKKIRLHQMPFLKEVDLIDYYNKDFYYDARFPQEPLDIAFAKEPEKYCRNNKNIYPCYKWYSRFI